uniref:Uncharacterized protein n=1 Tax=Piliocolobus tephrosceles TaxID=591936 RepID=A0A8C9I7W7_9PRIM
MLYSFIHMKGFSLHLTEFAEPFQVLSDEFLFALQYLSNWDSTLLLLSYLLYLLIYHKSHSFAELVFFLHHYISFLVLLRADVQHFYLSFLSELGAVCSSAATITLPLTEHSGKFPDICVCVCTYIYIYIYFFFFDRVFL